LREAWACETDENPRLSATAVANALAVATFAIFIGNGELEKVMRHFYKYCQR
jgi:hypothetical protein